MRSVNRDKSLGREDGINGSTEAFDRIERLELGLPMMAHGALYLGPVGLGALLFAKINSTLPSMGMAGMLELGSF